VPFGTGQVGVSAFLKALKEVGYTGPLALEREADDNRLGDIAKGIEAIKGTAPARS
jgi:L-ribulose-5-phosphate 3-epimerase